MSDSINLIVENEILKHNVKVLTERISELLNRIDKLEQQNKQHWLEKLI